MNHSLRPRAATSATHRQQRRGSSVGSALVLGSLCLSVIAFASSAHADERARISRERHDAEMLYRAREQACQADFVVTSCVEAARAERRAKLQDLAQQQAVLDDAQRKQRAAQRMQQIHEKVTREGDAARQAPPVRVRTPKTRGPDASASGAAAPLDVPEPPSAGASRAAVRHVPDASRSKALFDRRQREAVEHREEVERKAVDRASRQTRPPTSLPPTPEIPASGAH